MSDASKTNQIPRMESPNPWAGAWEHVDIVREVSERGPFIDDGITCLTCDPETAPDIPNGVAYSDWFADPANHEPTCLWKRARALYPRGGQ